MSRIHGHGQQSSSPTPNEPQELAGHRKHHHKKDFHPHPQPPAPKPPTKDEIKNFLEHMKKELASGKPLNEKQVQEIKNKLNDWLAKFPVGSKERNLVHDQLDKFRQGIKIDFGAVEKALEQLTNLK